MGRRLRRNNAAALDPTKLITVSDAKAYLKVENSADDTIILEIIQASYDWVEEYLHRSLLTQDWILQLDDFPRFRDRRGHGRDRLEPWWEGTRDGIIARDIGGGRVNAIVLARPPVQSVAADGVKFFTRGNVEVTVDAATYFVDTISEHARIVLNDEDTWPIDTRTAAAVQVRFKAGYGITAPDLPQGVFTGWRQLIAHMYAHRGDQVEAFKVPDIIPNLLMPYRMDTM